MKTQTLEMFIIFHKLMFTVLHLKKKQKLSFSEIMNIFLMKDFV